MVLGLSLIQENVLLPLGDFVLLEINTECLLIIYLENVKHFISKIDKMLFNFMRFFSVFFILPINLLNSPKAPAKLFKLPRECWE